MCDSGDFSCNYGVSIILFRCDTSRCESKQADGNVADEEGGEEPPVFFSVWKQFLVLAVRSLHPSWTGHSEHQDRSCRLAHWGLDSSCWSLSRPALCACQLGGRPGLSFFPCLTVQRPILESLSNLTTALCSALTVSCHTDRWSHWARLLHHRELCWKSNPSRALYMSHNFFF